MKTKLLALFLLSLASVHPRTAFAACSYTVEPWYTNVVAAGANITFSVKTDAGCAWTAEVMFNDNWIHITSGSSGSGNRTVYVRVDANGNCLLRTGGLRIAGQTISVYQDGLVASYSIAPSQATFPPAGGNSAVNITVNCPDGTWSIDTPPSWVHFAVLSGQGSRSVQYSVDANTNPNSRTTTIGVATKPFTITQQGISCSYSLNPTSTNHGAATASGSFSVVAPSGCGWTPSTTYAWIHLTSGSGSGDGTVSYTVDANGSTSPRPGTINVQGQIYSIYQAGIACTYSISPTSTNHGAAAENGNFSASAPTGCSWAATTVFGWIHVTSGSGSGNGSVSYTVDANGSTSPRSGSINVQGQAFTIIQAGIACTYSISPTSANHGAGAESGSFSVDAPSGCVWTATTADAWIHISAGSGNGNGTVAYGVEANPVCIGRTGTIIVADQTFTVHQAARTVAGIVHVNCANTGGGADGSLPRPFPTIRQAYDAACNEDLLRIFTCNYLEELRIDKTLRLESTNGLVRIGP